MFLNNKFMLFNLIGHMYVMYPWTTWIHDPYVTYSWSSPIHYAFRGALSGPISSLMGIPIYCVLKTFQLYYLDSVLPAIWYFLPTVYTCLNGVALAQHSEATLTPRVIRMFECVCVYGEWDQSPRLAKKSHSALPRLGTLLPWSNSNRRTPKQDLPSWVAS